ncbi:winged helix-turn-helix domain-containing protein, partial [Corynebacterium pseudotuberculosis]
MRSELVTHLPIAVDSSSSQPLPVQITSHIRSLVSQKIIAPGDHIPSSRSLAAQLGVSRGTVLAAYEQLSAEGYLLAAHGSGTMINPHLAALQPPPPPIGHTLR